MKAKFAGYNWNNFILFRFRICANSSLASSVHSITSTILIEASEASFTILHSGGKVHLFVCLSVCMYVCVSVCSAIAVTKGTGITIREDLSPLRLQDLQRAIQKYGLKNVWTEDGKIVYIDQGRKYYATNMPLAADVAP